MKWKELFTNWRVIMLLVFLLFAIISIQPHFSVEGVTIRSVALNSSASLAGIENPSAKLTPLQKERIVAIDGTPIKTIQDYYEATDLLPPNQTVRIETNRQIYTLRTQEKSELGLKVYPAPTSNLRKGLDLEGGTRVVLKSAEPATKDQIDLTIDNLKERLNVYGLSDVVVRAATDLAGEDFIIIEIAGVTEDEVKELLSKQGKFEAKVGNETVFFGGSKDITYVCRSAECSGINPQVGCSTLEDGSVACSFFFSISLSPEAAERQAQLTQSLAEIPDGKNCYLEQELVLFLDDKEVDRLKIGCELKGRASSNIQISGSGIGVNQPDAITNTLQNMKKLQTILVTGSLPVKLEIVKLDTISPALGKEFLDNVLLVGALAILSVVVVVLLRYRQAKVVLPMALTLLAEIVLLLGFAALVGWNLDLAAIAGIIITIGTGVNHLVVITDETLGRGRATSDWKQSIKNAMFIVMGAYLVDFAGMIPLWFAGAGLLKGFAFTTIVGLSFGVLISRPAYAVIIEKIMHE